MLFEGTVENLLNFDMQINVPIFYHFSYDVSIPSLPVFIQVLNTRFTSWMVVSLFSLMRCPQKNFIFFQFFFENMFSGKKSYFMYCGIFSQYIVNFNMKVTWSVVIWLSFKSVRAYQWYSNPETSNSELTRHLNVRLSLWITLSTLLLFHSCH